MDVVVLPLRSPDLLSQSRVLGAGSAQRSHLATVKCLPLGSGTGAHCRYGTPRS